MNPEQALALQDRINREIGGLRQMVDQLTQPEAGATMAGLKSGLVILVRSLLRTNQIIADITRVEVEPPAGRHPFADLFRK